MRLRFVETDADGLGPYASRLHALEASIPYPIADGADSFTIDHGARYGAFFEGLGEARFLVALDGEDVVGMATGTFRTARFGDRVLPSAYMADFKVAPSHRGRGVARAMMTYALFALRHARNRRWRLAYGAAMRGARGDIMRTRRGVLHPLRLFSGAARLALYFADPAKLVALDPRTTPALPACGLLDLSPDAHLRADADGLESTRGKKDLRLASSGAPWPLVHLPCGPSRWSPTLGHHLKRAGEALVARAPSSIACFALDARLDAHLAWLSRAGVEPGAVCTVYTLPIPPAPRRPSWIHLATSEI